MTDITMTTNHDEYPQAHISTATPFFRTDPTDGLSVRKSNMHYSNSNLLMRKCFDEIVNLKKQSVKEKEMKEKKKKKKKKKITQGN